jgi:hypothetical protein
MHGASSFGPASYGARDVALPFRHQFATTRLRRRFVAEAVVQLRSGERRTLRRVVRNCPAPTGALARLATSQSCQGKSLLFVSVERATGPPIEQTVFVVYRQRVVDRHPPFGHRFAPTNLPSKVTVRAYVTFASGTRLALRRSAEACP